MFAMHVSNIPDKRNHHTAVIATVLPSQARPVTNKDITHARNVETLV